MNLQGKVALVTGGDSGIGAEICRQFASLGAKVVINYRSSQDDAESVKADVEQSGSAARLVQADLSEVSQIHYLVEQAVGHFGQIDILVNNAGLEKEAPFCEVTEADYDAVLDVNLKAVFFTTQAVVRHLLDRKSPGRIVNISSVHDELPFPGYTSYCASKGGVQMITRNLAVELGPTGITVNSVSPGAIQTPINQDLKDNPEKRQKVIANIPLGRIGRPDDVSHLVSFLASDQASYITGSTFYVDGGLLWNYDE